MENLDTSSRAPGHLEIRGLKKSFGTVPVLKDINLTVPEGACVALLGPSGCGKSTILKTIAGFFEPDSGSIEIAGRQLISQPSHKRNLGMVFQDYALFPHMTVAQNVGFGLAVRKQPKNDISKKVKRALALVQLQKLENRFPSQLSGGQKQRVAIARALAIEPSVLLCDEPLSNLDAKLRKDLLGEMIRIRAETRTTMVYVTHDQEEAIALADTIVLLNNGEIEQSGTPIELFETPKTVFAADFMGFENFLPARISKRDNKNVVVELPTGQSIVMKAERVPSFTDSVVLSFRSDRTSLSSGESKLPSSPSENCLQLDGAIISAQFRGAFFELLVDVHSGNISAKVHVDHAVDWDMTPGSPVRLRVDTGSIVLLPESDSRNQGVS